MKYIDEEKLISEIERWRDKEKEKYNESIYSMGRCDALAEFRNHIISLQQEQPELPGIEEPGIPGKDFIPVEWVEACERYGKWRIVKQEQQEVDLVEEITRFFSKNPIPHEHITDWPLLKNTAIHFAEWGAIHLNARKEE